MQFRISIGVDPGIVSEEMLHLVKAVLGRKSIRRVPQMPLARHVRCIAVLLVKLGDGGYRFVKLVRVTGSNYHRQRGSNGNTSSDERGTPRRATGLSVPSGKPNPFRCHTVEIRRRRAASLAAAIGTQVAPAHVVPKNH